MPKIPVVSGKKVIKVLNKIGFETVSQKGSHIKLIRQKRGKVEILIVPKHKEIHRGTLKNGILNQIGLEVEEFIKLLK
ncbi:MAG: type II toxin-antitoxin system HicA family toxin [Candidatus Shapirobacteria bacterium]